MKLLDYLRGTRETPWIPLAMVEEGAIPFREEHRLTTSLLRTVAEQYDPKRFLAPVISSQGPPVHRAGEFSDPLGHVSKLRFDGNTLWGKVTEIEGAKGRGKLTDAVSRGRIKRSVGIWPNGIGQSGGTGQPSLRHVEILSGVPEGQSHLPPLSQYLESALGPEIARAAEAAGADSVILRSYEDSEPGAGQPLRSADSDGPGEPGDQEEGKMTDQEIMAAMERSMSGVVRSVSEAVDAKLLPVNAAIKELQEGGAATRAAMDGLRTDVGMREVSDRVQSLVRSGHVPPAEEASEIKGILRSTPEEREERYKVLGARSPISKTRQPVSRETPHASLVEDGGIGRAAAGAILGEAMVGRSQGSSVEQLGQVIAHAGEGVAKPGAVAKSVRELGIAPSWLQSAG